MEQQMNNSEYPNDNNQKINDAKDELKMRLENNGGQTDLQRAKVELFYTLEYMINMHHLLGDDHNAFINEATNANIIEKLTKVKEEKNREQAANANVDDANVDDDTN